MMNESSQACCEHYQSGGMNEYIIMQATAHRFFVPHSLSVLLPINLLA